MENEGLEAITSPVSTELKNGKQFYTYTKEDVEIIERELKAFEIIRNKKVNVIILMGCDSVEEYNKHPLSWKKLTEQEYDLLKEVLK